MQAETPRKQNSRLLFRTITRAPLTAAHHLAMTYPPLRRLYFKHYASYKSLHYMLKKRLNILYPVNVQWLATYNCNFSCIHCEASAGTTKVSELTTEEVFSLVDELAAMRVKHLLISGGEPLLRNDIFDIIRHIREAGMQYGIATNGYLVSRYHDEFRKYPPELYFTSIDGLSEANDRIRGMPGAFRNCMAALEFFRSINVPLRIVNTVALPGTIETLPEMKTVLQQSAATLWSIALPIPVGRAKENNAMSLNNDQIRTLFSFIAAARREMNVELTEDAGYLGCLADRVRSEPFFCGAGLKSCAIMPDGEVLGCQIAYDASYSEGNIRTTPFREIWEKGFSRFRNPSFDASCRECPYVRPCRNGCWGMRLGDKHCLREIWDDPEYCKKI